MRQIKVWIKSCKSAAVLKVANLNCLKIHNIPSNFYGLIVWIKFKGMLRSIFCIDMNLHSDRKEKIM